MADDRPKRRIVEGDGFTASSERPGEVVVKLIPARHDGYSGPVEVHFKDGIFIAALKKDGGGVKVEPL